MNTNTNIWIHAIKSASYEESSFLEAIPQLNFKYSAKSHQLGDSAVIKALTVFGGFEEYARAHHRVLKLDLEASERKLRQYEDSGIKVTNILQDDYPQALWQLKNPPTILYYYGDLNITKSSINNGIAIVGTRDASNYGIDSTKVLVEACTPYQSPIVSGLARGVDSEAHRTALNNQIPTIAILGSGLKQFLYNGEQKELFSLMQNNPNALIVSEFEPEQTATHWTFAHRNRLIAALSKITVVIEAPFKSGSLITADYALELGRTVYALNGEGKAFAGNLKLINQGKAKPLFSIKLAPQLFDLVQEIQKDTIAKPIISKQLNPVSEIILDELKASDMSFDSLLAKLKLNRSSLLSNLSILEMEGLVLRGSAANYCLAKSFSE